MSFLTLVLLEIIYSFSCKNIKESTINKNILNNSFMNKSIFLLLIIQVIIFVTPLKSIFSLVNLSFYQVLYCVILVIFIFLIDELSKNIIKNIFKD